MTILYEIEKNLYVNVTNKCPCSCTFCVRQEKDSVHGCESLWLEHDPSLEEIIAAFEMYDLSNYKSIIFCGYGEPLERLDTVLSVCQYIRSKSNIQIRINTNGLSDLIHKKETAKLLKGLVDAVSISLNAPTKEDYNVISRPIFGEEAFPSLLKFAKDCKESVGNVTFTVVRGVITEDQIEACRSIAKQMEVSFRVREKI